MDSSAKMRGEYRLAAYFAAYSSRKRPLRLTGPLPERQAPVEEMAEPKEGLVKVYFQSSFNLFRSRQLPKATT